MYTVFDNENFAIFFRIRQANNTGSGDLSVSSYRFWKCDLSILENIFILVSYGQTFSLDLEDHPKAYYFSGRREQVQWLIKNQIFFHFSHYKSEQVKRWSDDALLPDRNQLFSAYRRQV